MNIGSRLKAARATAGMSLRALAEKTGFSASFLSQVELGQTSPSLGSLDRIGTALGLSLAELVSESAPAQTPILRRKEREALRSEWSRATAESLVPTGTDERLAAVLLSIESTGKTGKMELQAGARQFAYCLRGQVRLVRAGETHELETGDSVVYDGPCSAAWENNGQTEAEVLLVSARLGAERRILTE